MEEHQQWGDAMRKMARGWSLALVAVAAAGTMLAVGCGGDDGYGSSSSKSSSPAAGGVALVKVGEAAKVGKVLTDSQGKTLYTFKVDTGGKSACNESCATLWPPLTTTAATLPEKPSGVTGNFATITRDDGAKQLTYNGQPLYRYSVDKAAGEANGEGVGGVWFAAKLAASSADSNNNGYNY